MSKHLTDLAAIQDADGFRTAFEDALSDKVASALEDRKVHVAQNFFTDVNHIQNEAFRDEKEIADKVGKTNINVAYRKALANGPRILDKRAHDEVKSAESDADTVAKLVKKTPVSKFVSSRKGDGKVRTEEVEPIDEISDKTKTSYVAKATKNIPQLQGKKGHLARTAYDYSASPRQEKEAYKKMDKLDKKIDNRKQGISRAIANEEVEQVDEISQLKLANYVAKAATSLHNNAKEAGQYDDKENANKAFKRWLGIKSASVRLRGRGELPGKESAIGAYPGMKYKTEEVEPIDEISVHTKLKYLDAAEKSRNALNRKWDKGIATQKEKESVISREDGQLRAEKGIKKKTGKYSNQLSKFDKLRYKITNEDVNERTMEPEEMDKREKIVKGMKKSVEGFRKRYGSRAKEVMYATATKLAKD